MIDNLLVAITFFFTEDRLIFLRQISQDFKLFAKNIRVHVVTNVQDPNCHEMILNQFDKSLNITINYPTLIGHPFLLPWMHFDIFKDFYYNHSEITHFLYLEDDIKITKDNIAYWLHSRQLLRGVNFIPSFVRYEYMHNSTVPCFTDLPSQIPFNRLPRVWIDDDYLFLNMPNPYQGMYLMDRELMTEHLNSQSSHPDFQPVPSWHIRERAAQGITYNNVPEGFFSRNLVGFIKSTMSIDKNSLIHHLPNNYANNPNTSCGKISVDEIFIF